ncbi:phage portal protein [Dysgonomonas massiliensis]|uniref:phage portal protein n=1 Tax=Dysgonomonas massiliensis TaxID=2040292 RepID=UPI000C771C91|nr:phage portal protein [Dysgonomonas massiliensis]
MAKKDKETNVESIDKIIEFIKSNQQVSDEKIAEYKKAYDVKEHEVFNRPDRTITEVFINDKGIKEYRVGATYEANKIGDPLANEIVEKAVSFTAGNKPHITYNTTNKQKEEKLKAILEDNKELSLNVEAYESLYAFSEVAEIWYYDEEKSNIRVHLVSPMFGYKLYPIIDRKRKMTGFAYSIAYKENDKEVEELVYYTDQATRIFENRGEGWVELKPNSIDGSKESLLNVYGKITVVYTNQGKSDYEDVIQSIYRRETTVSNAGESTDRSAFPHLLIEGELNGISTVPGQNSTYELGVGGKISYVESDQTTSLLEFDVEQNEEIIRKRTQTPDISLESLKGLGNISGEMLERLLVEPTLKARRKITKYLIKHHQRRMNVLNAMVSYHNNWKVDDITFSVEIEPYVPKDIDAKLDRIIKIAVIMPKRYVLEQYKKEIDPSIDIDAIMGFFSDEAVGDLAEPYI